MGITAIGERKPAQHLEQLPGSQYSIARADRIAAMHGFVAEVFEQAEATHLVAGHVAEHPRIHQIRQGLGGNRPLQLPIVVVHPLHQQLDGAAGVEAGGAGIGECELLDLLRLLVQVGPLLGDQGELRR